MYASGIVTKGALLNYSDSNFFTKFATKCYTLDSFLALTSVPLFPQLVLADRNETISGGNFHGEYPAKVSGWIVNRPFTIMM